MKLKNFKPNRKQSGFTLIELMVVLAIIAILAVLAATALDTGKSKAQVMLGLAKQVGDANIQLKTDTGCYVNKPVALFNPTSAQVPANNYCGKTFGQSWSRAYLAQYPVDGNGSILAEKLSQGATVSLQVEAGGLGKRYFVRVSNVPVDIIRQALIECNNNDAGGSFDSNTCRSLSDLNGTNGDFDMLFSSTR